MLSSPLSESLIFGSLQIKAHCYTVSQEHVSVFLRSAAHILIAGDMALMKVILIKPSICSHNERQETHR